MLSPKIIEFREIGAESKRSKVFTRRSRVNETGSICEAENSKVIEINPGISVFGGAFFPMAKDRNIKRGKSMPETIILDLK